MENNDDGSLGFLNIQPDEDRKYFHCEEITQQKLLNKSFWGYRLYRQSQNKVWKGKIPCENQIRHRRFR